MRSPVTSSCAQPRVLGDVVGMGVVPPAAEQRLVARAANDLAEAGVRVEILAVGGHVREADGRLLEGQTVAIIEGGAAGLHGVLPTECGIRAQQSFLPSAGDGERGNGDRVGDEGGGPAEAGDEAIGPYQRRREGGRPHSAQLKGPVASPPLQLQVDPSSPTRSLVPSFPSSLATLQGLRREPSPTGAPGSLHHRTTRERVRALPVAAAVDRDRRNAEADREVGVGARRRGRRREAERLAGGDARRARCGASSGCAPAGRMPIVSSRPLMRTPRRRPARVLGGEARRGARAWHVGVEVARAPSATRSACRCPSTPRTRWSSPTCRPR